MTGVEITLHRLSVAAENDPLCNEAFELWFHQQGFPGSDKMAAAYAWCEARRRARSLSPEERRAVETARIAASNEVEFLCALIDRLAPPEGT